MKRFVLLSMLSALLWTGCTKQETLKYMPGEDEVSSSFMAVSIVSAGSAHTRAGNYQDPGKSPEYGKDYRDGETFENHVNDALFFFFDSSNEPARVFKKDAEKVSYYHWTQVSNTGDPDHSQTVEKILETTLQFTISNSDSDNLPTQILTVLNPTNSLIEATETSRGLSLATLLDIVDDYEEFEKGVKKLAPTTEEDAKKHGFVMSNSVYVDDNQVVYTTNCKDQFKTTAEEAKENPVTIYVERVLARIDLTIDIKGQTAEGKDFTIYPLGDIPKDAFPDNDVEYDNTQLYVRFLGWNVFDTPKKSRLIKEVNKSWTNDQLFGLGDSEPWNAAIYHRSFWAINPELVWSEIEKDGDYRFGPFVENKTVDDSDFSENNTWTADHNDIPVAGKYVTDYFQENAAPLSTSDSGPEYPSKVIIAAQLVNQKGEAQNLARWGMRTSTTEGLLNYFANSLNMWKKSNPKDLDNGATATTYTKISPQDLTFEKTTNGSHLVTLTLIHSDQDWYQKNSESETYSKIENPEDLLNKIVGSDNISVWNNGYTYYYARIQHLGKKDSEVPGEFGVVRNHIYDTHIKSVQGLGVPVYKKDEDIVKTEPTEQEWMLEAKVNILSWRVVSQSYDLTW